MLEEVLEIRDCEVVAGQVQTSELRELPQHSAELLEEGSGLVLVDETVSEIEGDQLLLTGEHLKHLIELFKREAVISEREVAQLGGQQELLECCFDGGLPCHSSILQD